jgi:glycosyltransferase involved in cell wall biosynthesis
MNKTIAFVWENFGPLHVDRCEAVMSRGFEVIGIEFTSRSSTYEWMPTTTRFKKVTLFDNKSDRSLSEPKLFRALVSICYQSRAHHIFFCHYERPATLFSALAMRGIGRDVYMMNESKFDDFPRNLWREVAKRQFFRPYQGCLAGSKRTQDYMRFLGIRPDRIARGYDTVSVRRMQTQLSDIPSVSVPFDQRHFTIVARLVEKKNHKLALQAYRSYLSESRNPRRLVICGSGFLEKELKTEVTSLSLDKFVTFTGFIQTKDVSRILSSSLALILPSTEEQFGQVVLEAIATGLPVLVSEACGARDELVRTGVNGFVFEPDNPEGLAWFMSLLANDQNLWMKMVSATKRFLPFCDVAGFADGVEQLVSINSGGVARQRKDNTLS